MTTIEQMAGVPSAAELDALANAWFPDLTENVYGFSQEEVAEPAVPEVNANDFNQGYGSLPGGEVPAVYGSGIPDSTVSQGYTGIPETGASQNVGSPDPGIDIPEFDWEHPFAYGGDTTDPYFRSVEEASAPEANFSSAASDVPAVDNSSNSGYAPVVMSQTEAAENGRKIDAPTSLGGDSTPRATVNDKPYTSRDESIRIGSKTLAQIRSDFPILNEKINGNKLVWLDNGATTQRPKAVIDRLSYYFEHENSNVHRGAHTLAARSTDAYENARDIVRDFIGAPSSEEIVFVRGTTEAINLVANAYVKPQLQPGDEIIVSILEHHANIVPWQLVAQETGAIIKVIPCDESGQLLLH